MRVLDGSQAWLERGILAMEERERHPTPAPAEAARPVAVALERERAVARRPLAGRASRLAAHARPKSPEPQPRPGEVLIAVHAAGLNHADLLQLRGLYPPPPGESEVPGLECAGVVLEAARSRTRASGPATG